MNSLPLFLIRCYKKLISPFLGMRCRFYPSCSDYALESIREFGFLRGATRSFMRFLRCHPFSRGGYDPVKS